MNSSVSIVIPAYNCAQTILKTLDTLKKQTYQGPIEIIIVDDGSTDNTSAVVRSFPHVKYFYQKNSGPASARNYGAREAQGEFVFFTDSDCLPHKDWIEKALQGFTLEKIAAVAGSYGIANPESPLARCVYAEILFRHQTLMPDYVKAFGSYNVCIRKKVFEEVGGFDEDYRNASGEDNDLSYKIQNAGYKIYFERGSVVDHYHPVRFGKYMREQFQHGFWRVKMYADHPKMAKGDDYTFWKDIVEIPWAAMICLFFIFSVWAGRNILALSCLLLFFLVVLELFFSWKFCRALNDAILMAFVLTGRSFSRFFGFSTGILNFLIKKNKK